MFGDNKYYLKSCISTLPCIGTCWHVVPFQLWRALSAWLTWHKCIHCVMDKDFIRNQCLYDICAHVGCNRWWPYQSVIAFCMAEALATLWQSKAWHSLSRAMQHVGLKLQVCGSYVIHRAVLVLPLVDPIHQFQMFKRESRYLFHHNIAYMAILEN